MDIWGNKIAKKKYVLILLGVVIIFSVLVSWGVYRDVAAPVKMSNVNIQKTIENMNCGFSYIGDFKDDTLVEDTQNGEDKATRFDYIVGNGYKTNVLELDGYAYILGEGVKLFNTSVLLKNTETGEQYKLHTEVDLSQNENLTTDGELDYSYGYFKSVVCKKYLQKNVKYQVLILYANNNSEKCILETPYCIILNDNDQVEVGDINENS